MRILAFASALAFAAPASGAVLDAQPNGFQVRSVVQIKAPPARVYDALLHLGAWWSSEHTYSGDARNMTLEAKAGGCFCEALKDGGSIQHAMVVYAAPSTGLRLRGGLGPLQSLGTDGALDWQIKATAEGSTLTQTYTTGGYAPGGMAALAKVVDEVMDEQARRLKAYLETGKPGP